MVGGSNVLKRVASTMAVGFQAFIGFYYLVSSPPLHLFVEPLPAAGPGSIYVPGAGFSGFWYHLGYFSAADLDEKELYCYSSGCLSLALSSVPVKRVHQAATTVQRGWLQGELGQYDIVEAFLQEIILDDNSEMQRLLPRLHVLSTEVRGVREEIAETIPELRRMLMQTTHIPFVTGSVNKEVWDGGFFFRSLHPECESVVSVPLTWMTTIHTFNPGLDRKTVIELYEQGARDAKSKQDVWEKSNQSMSAYQSIASDDRPPSFLLEAGSA